MTSKHHTEIDDLTGYTLLKDTHCHIPEKYVKLLSVLQNGEYWVLLATFPSTKIKSIFQQCALQFLNLSSFH